MAIRVDPHVLLARRCEAAARGRAVLVVALLAVTVPVVHRTHPLDDGGVFVDEPTGGALAMARPSRGSWVSRRRASIGALWTTAYGCR